MAATPAVITDNVGMERNDIEEKKDDNNYGDNDQDNDNNKKIYTKLSSCRIARRRKSQARDKR